MRHRRASASCLFRGDPLTWRRLGLVYRPPGESDWSRSHAAQPAPVLLGGDVFRFFFSTRDAQSRSHVGWVDIDLRDRPRVIGRSQSPVLAPGHAGTFDDSGVSIGSAIATAEGVRIYYMGWNLGVLAPWRNSIGLMWSGAPEEPFARYSEGPLLDRSPEDPYTLTYPCVLQLAPQRWRMWYGSSLSWGKAVMSTSHIIKQARSRDGLRWERDGRTIVPASADGEQFLVRPTVLRVADVFLMLFASRGERYRLGAAVSADGESWTRQDQRFGLEPGTDAWENEEVCYPALFTHRDRVWLAYNGNHYGLTGFGLAVWDGPLDLT